MSVHKTGGRLEYEGLWWLPTDRDAYWQGTLSWEPKKSPRLLLRYRSVGAAVPPDEAEAFHGLDSGGTPITVLRVGLGGRTEPGLLSEKRYRAGHILRGIHVSSLNEFRANRLDVSFQYLDGWINEDPFSPWDTSNETWKINYKRPGERSFQLFPGTMLKLFHSSTSHSTYQERTIRFENFIGIEKQRPFNFHQAFKRINALRSFLHFACMRPVYISTLYFEDFARTFDVGKAKYPEQLELYTGSIHRPLKDEPHADEYVFTFTDVKDRFAILCKEWFQFCAEFQEALGCYMTTVYSGLSHELVLISMTQALEAYHQRRFRPKAGTEDVKFVNRIRKLSDLHSSALGPIVGDVEAFARSVTDSRHYHTHHDPDILRKGLVARGTPLTMMTYHLQFLFRLCVLSDFGLDRDPYSVLRRQMPSRVTEYF